MGIVDEGTVEVMMEIEPLSPALGARIAGFDLGADFGQSTQRALVELLNQYLVLVFPDQDLSPVRHVELGEMFGTPFIHPFLDAVEAHPAILEVVKEPDDTEPFGGEHWHADITFRNPPSSVSLLYSLDVPTMGGDTLFANQYLAYQSLSSGLQRMVGDLEAVHAYPEMDENDDQASAVHPVVRIHPLTGRKALFVNPAFVTRFVDMTPAESKPLLDYLYRQSTRPEFQLRISWTVNQLVVWDNRAVIHYAMNDYPGRRRVLRRVTAMERS